jgi:hypothetical protein
MQNKVIHAGYGSSLMFHVKQLAISLLLVNLCWLSAGCKKHEKPQSVSSVLLEPGNGVVMVVFGMTADFRREDWMAQIFIGGEIDTRSLPRIPMSDVQTIVVPNLPPGFYNITAHSWMRGTSPSLGGARDSVRIKAGCVTLLKARPCGRDLFPYLHTQLDLLGIQMWTLESPQKLHDYVTTLTQKSAKQ